MKLEKTIEFLDYLLEPLHLKTKALFYGDGISIVHLYGIEFGTGTNLFKSIDGIFDFLFNKSMKIGLYYCPTDAFKSIANPYFGCRSLEEAAIRRDLMSNS